MLLKEVRSGERVGGVPRRRKGGEDTETVMCKEL